MEVLPAKNRTLQILKYFGLVIIGGVLLAAGWKIYDLATHRTYRHQSFSLQLNKGWHLNDTALAQYPSLEEAERRGASQITVSSQASSQAATGMVITVSLTSEIEESSQSWTRAQITNTEQAGYRISRQDSIQIGSGKATRVIFQGQDNATLMAVYYVSGKKAVEIYGTPDGFMYRHEFNRLVKSFRFN
jgi:hypothetical protein